MAAYRSSPVAIGTFALYAFLITAVTARWTKLLPRGAWLLLHRLALVIFVMTWMHGVLAGTDTPALGALYVGAGLVVPSPVPTATGPAASGSQPSTPHDRRYPPHDHHALRIARPVPAVETRSVSIGALRVRRLVTMFGVIAALLLGYGSIRAAAAWTAASAPLTVAPVPVAELQDRLAIEQARSADLTMQLRALAAQSTDLTTALEAAQAQIAADSDHAKALAAELAAAKKKLAKLEASIARAKVAAQRRVVVVTKTKTTTVAASSSSSHHGTTRVGTRRRARR